MFNSIEEAYIKTVVFLENQGRRSVEESRRSACVYLSPNGDKCAVGAWIPDGHPVQKLTGNVNALVRSYPDLFEEGGPLFIHDVSIAETVGFWLQFQKVHDTSDSLTEINDRLFNLARYHSIKPLSLTKWER